MATFAWSIHLCLLAIASLASVCEGGCLANDNSVIRMCQTGTLSGLQDILIDANSTLYGNELCTCTMRQSRPGNVFISPIRGSVGCGVMIRFFKPNDINFYSVSCSIFQDFDGYLSTNDIRFEMRGQGRLNACVNIRSQVQGSTFDVQCENKVQFSTTSTTSPETVSTTPTMTTTRMTTDTPTTFSTTVDLTSSTPVSSTQSARPTTRPASPSTQPASSSTQPSSPPTQPPSSSTQPSVPSTQPSSPSTQPSTSSAGPTVASTQPQGSTSPPMPAVTQAIYRFPVPEVAGGVAAGIIIIILLVICVTCCTARTRSEKKPDEESLRGRESPEMQENGRGYAFDNMLYHASQKDLTGKSVTPPISETDHSDYTATKGLEELYASVNKAITDSTDIM